MQSPSSVENVYVINGTRTDVSDKDPEQMLKVSQRNSTHCRSRPLIFLFENISSSTRASCLLKLTCSPCTGPCLRTGVEMHQWSFMHSSLWSVGASVTLLTVGARHTVGVTNEGWGRGVDRSSAPGSDRTLDFWEPLYPANTRALPQRL